MNPRISVVVPTRNRAALLASLIGAILSQDIADDSLELIIVDDGSTDATSRTLALYAGDARVSIRRTPRHVGPAAARNLGWRSAVGRFVAFTDDDCMPQPGWLAGLLDLHARGYDVVQGRTSPDIEDYFERGTFSRAVNVTAFSQLYEACNISYRRSLLESLHGFDEAFGTSLGGAPNGEDADLGWRAAKSGARTAFAADAVVCHPVTRSSFTDSLLSRTRSYRMVYFIKRHPEGRSALPRRYFFQESHPWALSVFAAWLPAAFTRRRSAVVIGALGTVPYVRWRFAVRPLPGRRRQQPVIVAAAWLIDIADVLVLAAASARWRCLLL